MLYLPSRISRPGHHYPTTKRIDMKSRIFTAIAALLFAAASNADPSCAANYFGGIAPKIVNAKMRANNQEVCHQIYAVMFSGITRNPLWSAEHLTKDNTAKACALSRSADAFHPESSLPVGMRSELADYAKSGYDRGHMVPSGDAPTMEAQEETFSLANMSPQIHANNAGIWLHLENGTRNLAFRGHDTYMVSGPLFEGAEIKQLKKRVMVPTGFYKAVYDATTQEAGVFVITNTADKTFETISVDDLTKRAGIDVFPNLPAEMKSTAKPVILAANRTDCEAKHTKAKVPK